MGETMYPCTGFVYGEETRLSAGVFPGQPAKPVPARGEDAEAKRPAASEGNSAAAQSLRFIWRSEQRQGVQLMVPETTVLVEVTREGFPEQSGCLSFLSLCPVVTEYDKMPHVSGRIFAIGAHCCSGPGFTHSIIGTEYAGVTPKPTNLLAC